MKIEFLWGGEVVPGTFQGAPPAVLAALVARAGVAFNGVQPWDIQVYDARLYRRILLQGSLGFGEAYMDGWWACARLDMLFARLMQVDVDTGMAGWARMRLWANRLRHALFNLQSTRRAFQVGERHYDIGNDIFEAMLDSSMTYSCAYWPQATDLEQAQQAKLDLVCRKLELRPGEHLLEIGCGWGGLARHAAQHYGVRVTGITVSREQQGLAQARCAGLPVEIVLMDYRDIRERYDKLVSIGMFEHVGPKNYPAYFAAAFDALKDDGLFLLHTIGTSAPRGATDPWIDRYIFPNGRLPSVRELGSALEPRFLLEDWHNFGPDYDRTLMAWSEKFNRAWPRLQGHYDQRFWCMWHYYLMCSAGFFRARQGQLWQLVLSKRQRAAVYRSVR